MHIPSVRGLYQARAAAFSRAGSVAQASGGFSAQYAAALGGGSSQGGAALQELTIVGGQPSAQPQAAPGAPQAVAQPAGSRYVPHAVPAASYPLYIPAAAVLPAGAASPETDTVLARKVIDFAKQFVGTPYVAGGEDLRKGVDCSGFIQSVFAHFGIKLPRSSYRQSSVGTQVDPKDLHPGDLLFFKTADYAPVTHVAMYVGDGKIIHASSSKTGVIVSKLRLGGDFVIARRLLQP